MPFLLAVPQSLPARDPVASVVASTIVMIPERDLVGVEVLLISAILLLVVFALEAPAQGADEVGRRDR